MGGTARPGFVNRVLPSFEIAFDPGAKPGSFSQEDGELFRI